MHVSACSRDWSDSGVLALTGRSDGPPVIPPGGAASTARQLSSYLASATEHTEHPVRVDGAALLAERAAFTRGTRRGRCAVGGHTRLLRASDDWTVLSCARPDDHTLLGAMIGREIEGENPWPSVEEWTATHTASEFDSRVELLGLAGGIVHDHQPIPSIVPCPRSSYMSMKGAVVVDFSALWAGPLCAHLLGLAGARLIKVETPHRPDGARGGNTQFYDLLHAGHESVVLDPTIGADRKALFELVTHADIVVEASRPRALERFGLDAFEFVDRGAVWVSITARGRSEDRIGLGDDIAASSGLVARDEDGTPLFVGDAIADPLTGLAAAASVLSTTPKHGRLIDLSMRNVVRSTLGPSVHSDASAPRPPRHRINIDAMREVFAAMNKRGIPLTPGYFRLWQHLPKIFIRNTFGRFLASSSWELGTEQLVSMRDEVEVITTELRQLADSAGVPTPALDELIRRRDAA